MSFRSTMTLSYPGSLGSVAFITFTLYLVEVCGPLIVFPQTSPLDTGLAHIGSKKCLKSMILASREGSAVGSQVPEVHHPTIRSLLYAIPGISRPVLRRRDDTDTFSVKPKEATGKPQRLSRPNRYNDTDSTNTVGVAPQLFRGSCVGVLSGS